MKIIALAAALACLSFSPAWADPPPSAAPPYRPGVSLQPVAIYDAQGNITSPGSNSGGSVTAPGTSGSQAQAVQGITGGVPVGVSAASLPLPTGAATEATQQGVATSNAAINAATGTQADAATASGANTSIVGALRAIRDRILSTLTVSVSSSTLPTGAATSANQASEIAALGATSDAAYAGSGTASLVAAMKGVYAATTTRVVSYTDFTGQALAASAASVQTSRPAPSAYTKFNVTAGCDATGSLLVVRGSNDNFANIITVAVATIPAGSRNSSVAGATISAPVNMAAYHAFILNGSTATTCSMVSSYTAN